MSGEIAVFSIFGRLLQGKDPLVLDFPLLLDLQMCLLISGCGWNEICEDNFCMTDIFRYFAIYFKASHSYLRGLYDNKHCYEPFHFHILCKRTHQGSFVIKMNENGWESRRKDAYSAVRKWITSTYLNLKPNCGNITRISTAFISPLMVRNPFLAILWEEDLKYHKVNISPKGLSHKRRILFMYLILS